MAYAAGVDVGSTQTKAIVIDEEGAIVGRALIDTGANVVRAAERAFLEALSDSAVQEERDRLRGRHRLRPLPRDVRRRAGDRDQLPRRAARSTCFPDTRTVVDMGGQDTKAIRVGPTGEIVDFCMNDKCAAGTGRFLGAAAAALDIPLDRSGRHRAARRAAGQDQHHVHGVRRVRSAVMARQGQEDRGHPARGPPVDR